MLWLALVMVMAFGRLNFGRDEWWRSKSKGEVEAEGGGDCCGEGAVLVGNAKAVVGSEEEGKQVI